MASVKVSYTEAQEYIRKYLNLPDDFTVHIERKDAQEVRERRSNKS